jgi:hypothetical protein
MGCEGKEGPAGPQGPAGDIADLTCVQCHDGSNLIPAKRAAWEESVHGMGEAYVRGSSASCAGCHSGGGFQAMVKAGQNPGTVEAGDPSPTRQDCRTCHQIHETGTEADWALETTTAVAFYVDETVVFDGGKGNLCTTCHQPRRLFPDPVDGMITGISSHWGPHHGPQSAMLLGVAGSIQGTPMMHYTGVENTCVNCHLGAGDSHTFDPQLSACQACHSSATDFDIGDTQTEVEALITELGDKLVAAGLINENSEDGHPTVTEAPTAQATALWNWIYVAHEDKSKGVHNPTYAKALLNAGLAALE